MDVRRGLKAVLAADVDGYSRAGRPGARPYPGQYQHFLAQSLFALGRFEDAVGALQARLARQPRSDVSHVLLAACYGHLGRAEEARAAWEDALRVNPDYSIERRRQILPYKNPADFERVVEGLRNAGIAV